MPADYSKVISHEEGKFTLKVVFPLTKAGSGSDVFTMNLISGLHTEKVSAKIAPIPSWSALFPSLAAKKCDLSRPDIIHTNTWNGYGFKNELPLVATEYHVAPDPQFLPYTTAPQRLYYRVIFNREKKTLFCSDHVTAISSFTKRRMEAVFGYSDTEVIYCGIDPDLFRPSIQKEEDAFEKNTTILLYVGNHLRRKGSDLLVPIMKELGDDFLLLTTTGLRTHSRIQASNIRCLGKISVQELVHFYNLCDIFLFPSRLEGFGLCVAEAMACEKPIITTNASSLPELVDQDKGGILCNMDDVTGFAEAVRYLAEDESLRISMGKYNRRKVLEEFTIQKMAKAYVKAYQRIL